MIVDYLHKGCSGIVKSVVIIEDNLGKNKLGIENVASLYVGVLMADK